MILSTKSKILFCILISMIILLSHSFKLHLISSIIIILIVFMNKKIGIKFFFLLWKFKYLIFSLILLQLLFRRGGDLLYHFYFIKIYFDGINYLWFSLNRLLFCLLSILILKDIEQKSFFFLMRKWRFPNEIVLILILIIDYMDEFSSKFKTVKLQIKQRGFNLSEMKLLQKIDLFKKITFPVLAISFQNVKDKAIALELMQFGKTKTPTLLYSEKENSLNILFQWLLLAGFLSFLLFEIYLVR